MRRTASSSASAPTLAILKALGASGGAVVALALIEFLIVAALGVALGLALGAAMPFVVDALVRRVAAASARAGDLSRANWRSARSTAC